MLVLHTSDEKAITPTEMDDVIDSLEDVLNIIDECNVPIPMNISQVQAYSRAHCTLRRIKEARDIGVQLSLPEMSNAYN